MNPYDLNDVAEMRRTLKGAKRCSRCAELEREVERLSSVWVVGCAEKVDQLREALWECVKLSGSDVSEGGWPTWPPPEVYAVQCVKELRESYDYSIENAI